MKIRPLGDRVLVEPIEEKEQTVGGIIIPDSAKEKPMQGKVIAVGKKLDKDGKEVKFDSDSLASCGSFGILLSHSSLAEIQSVNTA